MSAPSFSYAQAARGQATTQASTPTIASPAPTLSTTSQEKDDAGSTTTAQSTTSSTPHTQSNDAKTQGILTKEEGGGAPGTERNTTSSDSTSISAAGTSDVQAASTEKSSRDVSSTPGSSTVSDAVPANTGDSAKADVADDDRLSTSAASEETKEDTKAELSPAPIPTVNVWDQRRRQQQAKAMQQPTTPAKTATSAPSPAGSAAPSVRGPSRPRDGKRASNNETDSSAEPNSNSANGAKPQSKRPTEVSRSSADQSRRSGTRGVRAAEKDEKLHGRNSLPSVQDVALWPKPDSAVGEEGKPKPLPEKTSVTDKSGNDDAANAKSRKKDWRPLDFVPSVNFQTPIPNVRGAKAKSGGRGGRDSSSRGGYNNSASGSAQVDKSQTSSASHPADKTTADSRDGSKETPSGTATSSRHPPSSNAAKRFSSDFPQSRDSRKPSSNGTSDKTKEVPDASSVADKRDFTTKNGQPHALNGESNHQHHGSHSDRRATSAKNTEQGGSVPGKESGPYHSKEQHGQSSRERTEARGDRPSRGTFRGGRGGHNASSSQSHHISHSTYPSSGSRVTTGSVYGNGASVLPPTAAAYSPSQPFFGNGSTRPNRGSGRGSQNSGYGSRAHNNGAVNSSRLHAHSSHVPGVQAEFHVQPSYSVPYNPYPDPELISTLIAQLDYYFSLDNLCKDLFLRRKMNDQGFVPLSVVSEFKRMAELAPSKDHIRIACEQSENLDYIVDQDQNELIRSRYLWNSFILPYHDRDSEARNSGPDLRVVSFRSVHSRQPQPFFQPMAAGYSPMPSLYTQTYQPHGHEFIYPSYDGASHGETAPFTNGTAEVNGRSRTSGSQLSAAVPDFSPSNGAPTTLEDYQNYPDEQVEKLVVPFDLSGIASDSADAADGKPKDTSEKPLRNGANGTTTTAAGEPYRILRGRAFDKRKEAKSGDTPADMKRLYQFWSQFLPEKFNVRMYEDFRSCSIEDARSNPPNWVGLSYLLRYYETVFSGPEQARSQTKTIPAVFKPHHAEVWGLSLKQKTNGSLHG